MLAAQAKLGRSIDQRKALKAAPMAMAIGTCAACEVPIYELLHFVLLHMHIQIHPLRLRLLLTIQPSLVCSSMAVDRAHRRALDLV